MIGLINYSKRGSLPTHEFYERGWLSTPNNCAHGMKKNRMGCIFIHWSNFPGLAGSAHMHSGAGNVYSDALGGIV